MIKVLALPQLSSMILAWVALFILYFILRKFLYKPVSNFWSKRKERIQSEIENAKGIREEATTLKNEYEERISLAKKESQEIIESAKKRGEELKENIIAEARKEAENIKERARKELQREREMAFESIRSQTSEMAILIASKIMEEKITIENHNKLIDRFIDEVGNSKWQS